MDPKVLNKHDEGVAHLTKLSPKHQVLKIFQIGFKW